MNAGGTSGLPARGSSPQTSDLSQHPAYAQRPTYTRGVVHGINRGYFRRQIAEASYRFSEECEAGDRIIVGVNAFTEGSEERPIDILQIPHEIEVVQCKRLADFKNRRDAAGVKRALDRIRETCRAGDPANAAKGLNKHNIMPALIDGALANCTLGEMVQAMADAYGRYSGGPEW
jgi:methylmalonyl-CoA mutase N-terminal domain/subunit